MRTIVYVDGFNLYYGALRGTPYRWLDLRKLCSLLLPGDEIVRIRYFTARISAREDPGKPLRQQVYLRALRTLDPLVSTHFGHYLSNPTRAALVRPSADGTTVVEVWKTEEKGSDVNLATYLLLDAFDGRMETAVIISNDSDLLMPVRVARYRFGLNVGVLNPHAYASKVLVAAADFHKQVRPGPLAASQFPDELEDAKGKITRPAEWQ